MKAKLDFVTNSSSSAFIISLREKEVSDFIEYVERLDHTPDAVNEGVNVWQQLSSKKELYEFATERPYDWASKAMGPKLINMDYASFDKALNAINNGFVVCIASVDYNVCEEFQNSQYERDIIWEMD